MEPTLRGVGDVVIHSPTTAVMETQKALECMMERLREKKGFETLTQVKYLQKLPS